MRRSIAAGALVALVLAGLALAGRTLAQDGGKIPWKGKDKGDDLNAGMAQAQKEGKAIMLFFTSKG